MIAYAVETSGQTFVLTESVLSHLNAHRQITANRREAGGQLFARFEDSTTIIERVTGPRFSDKRTFISFLPNRIAERHEIRRHFKLGLHYVGDWHTHPEPHPKPSTTDTWSIQDMFRKSKHQLAGFVMIIVGTVEGAEGLFVGVSDGKELKELVTIEA